VSHRSCTSLAELDDKTQLATLMFAAQGKSTSLRNTGSKRIARTFLMQRVLPEPLFEEGARPYLNLDGK